MSDITKSCKYYLYVSDSSVVAIYPPPNKLPANKKVVVLRKPH